MGKSDLFISNPATLDELMSTALSFGIGYAKSIGAKFGTLVVTIVLNGKQYLQAESIGGDIATDYDPIITFDDSPGIVGINYPAYAAGKAYQSIRTGELSEEGVALGFGESDSAGSFCATWHYEDPTDKSVTSFFIATSFSGLTSLEDRCVAECAASGAWYKIIEYQKTLSKKCHLGAH